MPRPATMRLWPLRQQDLRRQGLSPGFLQSRRRRRPIGDVGVRSGGRLWKTLAPLPGKRGAAVAVEVGGKIYVIGGVTTVRSGPFFTFFGPSRAHQRRVRPGHEQVGGRRPMTVARNHAFAGAVNGKIYVVAAGRPRLHPVSYQHGCSGGIQSRGRPVECSERAHADGPQRRRLGTDGRRIYVAGGEVTTQGIVGAFQPSRRTSRRPMPGPRCPPCRCRVTASRAR
jgi:hypothetical protein